MLADGPRGAAAPEPGVRRRGDDPHAVDLRDRPDAVVDEDHLVVGTELGDECLEAVGQEGFVAVADDDGADAQTRSDDRSGAGTSDGAGRPADRRRRRARGAGRAVGLGHVTTGRGAMAM